jgi:OHCU decarboxylase
MAPTSITLDALNGMSGDDFRRALGAVFEHSPWVAERAWPARPFATCDALQTAMAAAVRQASRDEQLALLRAHPDLGGKAARAGAMTDASVAEQSSAGLDRLSHEEYERFERLNTAYRLPARTIQLPTRSSSRCVADIKRKRSSELLRRARHPGPRGERRDSPVCSLPAQVRHPRLRARRPGRSSMIARLLTRGSGAVLEVREGEAVDLG